MKKKLLTLTMALALTLALAVPAFAAGFDDVKDGDYFAAPVNWAVDQNITKGTSSTKFSPEETCTRAQIITFLWRAAGSISAPTVEIADVSSDDYYKDAVMWAKDMAMFEGDAFQPNDPCTRLMAVDFMWQAAGSPEIDGDTGFDDTDSPAVVWAVSAGVTTGTSETTFSPDETCTRGQIVTFLYRAFADDEVKAADAAAAEKAAAEKAEAEKAAAEKAAAEKAEAEKTAVMTGVYVQPDTGKVITVLEVSYNANTEDDPTAAEGFIIILINDLETDLSFKGNVAENADARITFGENSLTFEVPDADADAEDDDFVKFVGRYDRQPLEGEE